MPGRGGVIAEGRMRAIEQVVPVGERQAVAGRIGKGDGLLRVVDGVGRSSLPEPCRGVAGVCPRQQRRIRRGAAGQDLGDDATIQPQCLRVASAASR